MVVPGLRMCEIEYCQHVRNDLAIALAVFPLHREHREGRSCCTRFPLTAASPTQHVLGSKDRVGSLQLWVSHRGGPFTKARFPLTSASPPQHLLGSKERDGSLQLWVSHRGEPFFKARFPSGLRAIDYEVVDVSDDQVRI